MLENAGPGSPGPEQRRQRAHCEASCTRHATRPACRRGHPLLGNNHLASIPPRRSRHHSSEADSAGDEATHLHRGRPASPGQPSASPAVAAAPAPQPAAAHAAEELGCSARGTCRGPTAGSRTHHAAALAGRQGGAAAGGDLPSRVETGSWGKGEGGAQRHGRDGSAPPPPSPGSARLRR